VTGSLFDGFQSGASPDLKTGTAKGFMPLRGMQTRRFVVPPVAVGCRAVEVVQDEQTREVVLDATERNAGREMSMPLAANEWRGLPDRPCQVSVSDDNHLVVTTTGRGAPVLTVWFDFQTRGVSTGNTNLAYKLTIH